MSVESDGCFTGCQKNTAPGRAEAKPVACNQDVNTREAFGGGRHSLAHPVGCTDYRPADAADSVRVKTSLQDSSILR